MKNLVAIIVGGTGQFGITTSEFLLKKTLLSAFGFKINYKNFL